MLDGHKRAILTSIRTLQQDHTVACLSVMMSDANKYFTVGVASGHGWQIRRVYGGHHYQGHLPSEKI